MTTDFPGIALLVRAAHWFAIASILIWPLGLWKLFELVIWAVSGTP